MLLLKELHHDNIVSLLGAGFLPDGRRFVALVSHNSRLKSPESRVTSYGCDTHGACVHAADCFAVAPSHLSRDTT